MNKNNSVKIAKALLDIGAVGFSIDKPITFKSGIISPVYVDNRILPSHPKQWSLVISAFQELLESKKIDFDLIAGVATAGIPHSAAIGYSLKEPSVFVRKTEKGHGTKKRVEGGNVDGKKVVMIEDHISTGYSSLDGIKSLKESGATVTDCLAITTYGWKIADQAFKNAKIQLQALTTFEEILAEAVRRSLINKEEKIIVENWLNKPKGWAKSQNIQ